MGKLNQKFCSQRDAYHYNGKIHSTLKVAADLAGALPSVQKVVVIPYVETSADISVLGENGLHWAEELEKYSVQDISYTRVNFSDPLFIMFSSGTTGLPKCIVHSVGGTLLQHLKEHQLQCDIKPNDRFVLFLAHAVWMMWNWLVSGLASGATLVPV